MESQKSFGLLEPKLMSFVMERFEKPTPIQEAVIPEILGGKNVLILSETGSGKTEAVLLPVWDLWLKAENKPVSILYITPLKSLNRDLHKRILWWSEKIGFEVSVRHGDTSSYERGMQKENPPDMLIITPETLQAILTGKSLREHLKNVKWVVVDEIHELVGSKRGVQLSVGLERLKEIIKTGGGPQLIGLSATIGSPEDAADFLSGSSEKSKVINTVRVREARIRVEHPKPKDGEKLAEWGITPEIFGRLERINNLIGEGKSTLLFTNTREFAEVLSSRMKMIYPSMPLDTHHSSLSKDVRIRAEEEFKNGLLKALVATSSLELGIDIGSVDTVIQYMSPRQVTKLLQRVGRSGHSIYRVSRGVIIATDADDCFEAAAIGKLGLEQKMEKTKIYPKSLDVLGHQIVGLSIEGYSELEKIYEVIKRAYPFRDLVWKEFLNVCLLLQKMGFLWINKEADGLSFRKRKSAWDYYFSNLSTIPDVKKYRIIDMISGRHIGTLDAEFIAMHGFPGTTFICKGEAWRIIEVEEGERGSKILVEPASASEAAIPAWEGELIPVPAEVAEEVGRMRKDVEQKIGMGMEKNDVVNFLKNNYPVSEETAGKMHEIIKLQKSVPDSKNILIEYGTVEGDYWAVINCCFGSLINETIGRVLSSLLTERIGAVGLQADPYRIMFKLSGPAEWQDVADVFGKLDPGIIDDILKLSLPKTELFSWRFLHVAQRFGVIKRGAEFGKGYLRKIADLYKGTAVYDEAFNEIFTEKLDTEGAKKILGMIRNGGIKVGVKEQLSPISLAGLQYKFEVVASEKPEKDIFEAFKKRVFETKLRLICCNCGFAINQRVKDLPSQIECRACKAKLVGVINSWDKESEEAVKRYVKRRLLGKDEELLVERVMDTASHVIGSGKNAVIALAGRGVGPKTAGRILAKMVSGDGLLKEVLKAEREYAKGRKFWR